MKTIDNIMSKLCIAWAGLSLLLSVHACKDNADTFELSDGVPTIRYVRVPDEMVSDSLLTGAFLGNSIAIIGENMKSVSEIWFNDQKAVLNTSFMTDEVIIVSVPREIPAHVTDKIYFVNKSKRDTVAYGFNVLVPPPAVVAMACEHVPEGEVAVLTGNYFLPTAEHDNPVVVFTPNIEVTEVVSYTQTAIEVVVPPGAQEGPVSVRSRYGTTRSTFYFRDTRGMITNYDADYPIVNSWGRAGRLESDPAYALSGNYLKLSGSFPEPTEWSAASESEGLSHYWGNENGRTGPLFEGDPAEMVMKFEAYVPNRWSAVGLSFIFAPTGTTNGPLYEDDKPRAIWMPWRNTGSYQTDGWVTVAIPLTEFKYNGAGSSVNALPAAYENLNIFLANRGLVYVGTACDPVILMDNLRIVPQ
ncbi:hypothetical protein SAMN05421747_11953 [Parapedobacter composti]|uniref:Surface glycan-binding protein B xyloglucan binding domain-containing protein n=1 Tax=Parapedobacter composti TaxID=623281 RepID=A0A1I1L7L0_9SPHI|nr:glycan-binding surface protein [Parapedobacter composti]SFC68975.1 hypothetical protein SAMN05421747_11953 [Parapedobacter composti]